MRNQRRFIRSIMTLKGITQQEVGAAIGRPQPWVSEWLNGWRQPSEEDAEKIAKILGIDKKLILG